jgi:hypothetical protein
MELKILFRGWSSRNKEWIYGTPCYSESGGSFIYEDSLIFMAIEVDKGSIQQFTGKVDKAGIKIYLGDINEESAEVIWNNDDASFNWLYPDGDMHPMELEEEWCNIVSNKFELNNQP